MNAHCHENATNSLEAVDMIEQWKIEMVQEVNRIGPTTSSLRAPKKALTHWQCTTVRDLLPFGKIAFARCTSGTASPDMYRRVNSTPSDLPRIASKVG